MCKMKIMGLTLLGLKRLLKKYLFMPKYFSVNHLSTPEGFQNNIQTDAAQNDTDALMVNTHRCVIRS